MSQRNQPLDDPDHPLYTMAQVTELLGVPAAALRRWEREGLIHPERTQGRQRRYSRRQIEQLRQVVQLAEEGLTAAGIRKVQRLQDRVDDLEDQLADSKTETDSGEADHGKAGPGRPGRSRQRS